MVKIAFLFPGQGSQVVGMGKDAAQRSTKALDLLKEADELLKFPLSQIMFDGPEEKLKDTAVTQPALFVASAVALELLKEKGISAQAAAGHSLGEYSALYAAGVLSFSETLRLVAARGKAMQEAALQTKGTMAAILGLSAAKLSEICAQVSKEGQTSTIANFNSDTQIVIAGTVEGVEKTSERAKQAGASKVVFLNVSGAFHSPLMSTAIEKMKPLLDQTDFSDARFPVITNVDAQPTTSAQEFKNKLALQIDHSVLWDPSMRYLLTQGFETFIEVGSGKVLSSLIRRLDRQKKVFNTDDFPSIEKDHATEWSRQ